MPTLRTIEAMSRNTSESPSASEAVMPPRLRTVEAEVDDAGSNNEHEPGEEDGDDVSVYDDGDEKAAVAQEREMLALNDRDDDDDDDDDDCVEVHEEARGDEDVAEEEPVETADTGDKKNKKRKKGSSQTSQKKKVRKEVVYDIQKFKHVELGSAMSKEEQNKHPVEPERQADIAAFEEDWQHTVTVRYELAKGIKTWPLPRDCPFSPAAKDTLCRLGIQRAMAMSLEYLTLKQQEILGRGRRRAFDLEDALELPALDASQQHEQVTYLDCVEDSTQGNGLYTGSATGKQGAAQRWTTYDTAKRLGHASKTEARSLHFKAFLRENAILHLRPLMIFPRSVSSTLVEIMEGLMMDFLETIDRSNLNEVIIGKNGSILMHDATMLERSKEAFPSKRHSTSCKGLNKVSSLKQATFGSLKSDCPAACRKCSSSKRACIVYCENETFQLCRQCKQTYRYARRYYICIGTDVEIFAAFVEVRKASGAFSSNKCFQQPPKTFECQHQGCTWAFTTSKQQKSHEKLCSKNPTPPPKAFGCRHEGCISSFHESSQRSAHEKSCSKNPTPPPKAFGCRHEGCTSSFNQSGGRDYHEKTCPKNPTPPPKAFGCQHEGCVKSFTTSRRRIIHENTCAKNPTPPPKAFGCRHVGCVSAFTTSPLRIAHEKTCAKKSGGLKGNP